MSEKLIAYIEKQMKKLSNKLNSSDLSKKDRVGIEKDIIRLQGDYNKILGISSTFSRGGSVTSKKKYGIVDNLKKKK
jgi:hypothetical protein|tara:strand:+ start:159 stop:389 length:231 start_codon:yes stop_codon:yes gene_type:complete